MKTLSCAVIVFNTENKILMCHSTGNKFWDLPKGGKDENETPEMAARREFNEETGLSLNSYELIDMGVQEYNRSKNIHLFVCNSKVDFDLSKAYCESFFTHPKSGNETPEVDDFKYFEIEEAIDNSAKSMAKMLTKFFTMEDK